MEAFQDIAAGEAELLVSCRAEDTGQRDLDYLAH
jgi:hypothetical protein